MLADACAKADFVIIAAKVKDPPKGCQVIDEGFLRKTGALAALAKARRVGDYARPERQAAVDSAKRITGAVADLAARKLPITDR